MAKMHNQQTLRHSEVKRGGEEKGRLHELENRREGWGGDGAREERPASHATPAGGADAEVRPE